MVLKIRKDDNIRKAIKKISNKNKLINLKNKLKKKFINSKTHSYEQK